MNGLSRLAMLPRAASTIKRMTLSGGAVDGRGGAGSMRTGTGRIGRRAGTIREETGRAPVRDEIVYGGLLAAQTCDETIAPEIVSARAAIVPITG